jgi:hypothetical protein
MLDPKEMKYDKNGGVYFDNTGDGPFCPVCWDKDGKRVHLTRQGVRGNYLCVVHQTWFEQAKDQPTQ